MAKKNYSKKENDMVNDVLSKVIINEEGDGKEMVEKETESSVEVNSDVEKESEPMLVGDLNGDADSSLEESLLLDAEKIENDIDEMEKDIFVENKEENKTINKKTTSRVFGFTWNGQEFDY